MKQLAGIEIIRVVKELKERILNAKINQIYVDFDRAGGTRKELLFELYVPNKGKELLRILLPHLIFLAAVKPEMPVKPDGYCLYLRKYLKNARIQAIEQVGAERIVKCTVEARDVTKKEQAFVAYCIYIELFSKGNFILTNDQNIILSPLEVQEWSGRIIKPKERYQFPKQEYNLLKMTEKDFEKATEESRKDAIVTTLALEYGLGGLYAEEMCSRAGIEKEKAPKKMTKGELGKLYSAVQQLIEEIKTGAAIVVKKENVCVDVYPCQIQKYKELAEACPSFFEGVNQCLTPQLQTKKEEQQQKNSKGAVEKVQTMIACQEKQIVQFQSEYEKNQRIGEMIYEKYLLLEEIFRQLHEARKTKSWDEIKKAVKNNKLIKQINEKDKEITVDL